MPSKVEAFKCDYCGKLLKRPHTAKAHEASCYRNPATRHCITCIHGVYACIGIAADWTNPYGPGTEVYGAYCGHHKKPISEKPYFIDCDMCGGIDTGFGVIPEEPVPYTCFLYKSKGKAEWTPEAYYNGGDNDV